MALSPEALEHARRAARAAPPPSAQTLARLALIFQEPEPAEEARAS